jgi:hypothetical protein
MSEREGSRVDELLHENDNLKKESEGLQERIKAVQLNGQTLAQTLNETQAELEALVNDHELLDSDFKRATGELKFF